MAHEAGQCNQLEATAVPQPQAAVDGAEAVSSRLHEPCLVPTLLPRPPPCSCLAAGVWPPSLDRWPKDRCHRGPAQTWPEDSIPQALAPLWVDGMPCPALAHWNPVLACGDGGATRDVAGRWEDAGFQTDHLVWNPRHHGSSCDLRK